MLSAIKRWFSGAAVDEKTRTDVMNAVQEGGLDVRSAIAAHMEWKAKLLEQLAGGGCT